MMARAAPCWAKGMGVWGHSVPLYVGDLDQSVTEPDLMQAFAPFGVFSARVCRDFATGHSLRYAYVNFVSLPHAAKALKAMNHVPMNGKPIRIMWSHRDPLPRTTGIGNLFVKNLDGRVGGAELERMFTAYGSVVSCKVAMDEYGKSKGFGFVQMDSEAAAQAAIEALHGKACFMGSKKLYVSKFVKKCDRQVQSEEPKCTNLYIKNLNGDITADLLHEKFSKFGKVSSAVVMQDEFGKSKGFGFVSFELPEHAHKAMETMNDSQLGSRRIYVGRAQKKAERTEMLKQQLAQQHDSTLKKTQGSRVYVKNLDGSVDEKKLKEHFAGCGKIFSAKVIRDANTLSRGFGFLSFSHPEEANKAVATFNGTMLFGRHLHVAIAKNKDKDLKALKFHLTKTLPAQHPTCHGYPSGVCLYYLGQPQNQACTTQQYGMGNSPWKQDVHFFPSPMFPYRWRQIEAANANSVSEVTPALQMNHTHCTAYPLPVINYMQPTRHGHFEDCHWYSGVPSWHDPSKELKKAYYSQFEVARSGSSIKEVEINTEGASLLARAQDRALAAVKAEPQNQMRKLEKWHTSKMTDMLPEMSSASLHNTPSSSKPLDVNVKEMIQASNGVKAKCGMDGLVNN